MRSALLWTAVFVGILAALLGVGVLISVVAGQ